MPPFLPRLPRAANAGPQDSQKPSLPVLVRTRWVDPASGKTIGQVELDGKTEVMPGTVEAAPIPGETGHYSLGTRTAVAKTHKLLKAPADLRYVKGGIARY